MIEFLFAQLFVGGLLMDIMLSTICVVVLLMFSALLSGSEVAFFSISSVHLEEISENDKSNYKLVEKVMSRPKYLLATILIANNFVNVSIVILFSYILRHFFSFSQNALLIFLIEIILITALILLFGEILPKIYASRHVVKFISFMVRPLVFLMRIFKPLSAFLIQTTSIIDKRISKREHNISLNELSQALEITSENENIREEDKKILRGIVRFGDIEVKEIMKPRIDVVAVDQGQDFDSLVEIILDSGYSRIPAYENTFDNITGILYVKDLLPYINEKVSFNWRSLLRPAFFVPENKKINDLLKEFQLKKIHMAIVVDEYGGASGIITLEDVIEEIVGDISDEYDSEQINYQKINENCYVFEGKTLLNDFYKILGIEEEIFDDYKGDSDTLAGLLLELKGHIPIRNETIRVGSFDFIVLSSDSRRIKKIKVLRTNIYNDEV